MVRTRILIGLAVAAGALGIAVAVMAQGHTGHGATPRAPTSPSRTITMEDLHRSGGVPRGWKFTLPSGGDAAKGRQLFVDLECFKCHASQAAGFPAAAGDGNVGPELSSMGGHHPAEYFAESIIAPNHVIVAGPGWIGRDGRSIMPSYADSLSVTQLLDLVAFIKSQDGGGEHADHDDGGQERVVGPYRVRLEFRASDPKTGGHAHGSESPKPSGRERDGGAQPKAGGHEHGAAAQGKPGERHQGGGHAGRGHHRGSAAGAAGAAGHLMAFITDATTGDAIPYLPVSAAIQGPGVPTRTVKLAPMLGRDGFHYGADATLPPRTQKVVVSIGATTMHVMGADRSRFARAHTVPFDWSTPAK